jgi:hypothetical protein
MYVLPNGQEGEEGQECLYIPTPFLFCLKCGVSYGPRQGEFSKLASLSSEGRSSATTILSLSAIQSVQVSDLEAQAQKLLSFTDNRQDASLQAGHFNDFIEVGMLRGAIYRAVLDAGPDGLRHETIAQRVFDALDLPLERYASDSTVRFQALQDTQKALRQVLGYRIYRDLRRGWRIASPNLEQCGLLEIGYESLDELSAAEDVWTDCHPALAHANPQTRQEIAKVLLDYLRRELAIKVDYLDPLYQERLRQLSSQRLVEPWAIDEDEVRLEYATRDIPMFRLAVASDSTCAVEEPFPNTTAEPLGRSTAWQPSALYASYLGDCGLPDSSRSLRSLKTTRMCLATSWSLQPCVGTPGKANDRSAIPSVYHRKQRKAGVPIPSL